MMTDTAALSLAIHECFETALPGWWWKVCVCGVSRHADCGPDYSVLEQHHPFLDAFPDGFSIDHHGSAAHALRDVMQQAIEAIAAFRKEAD